MSDKIKSIIITGGVMLGTVLAVGYFTWRKKKYSRLRFPSSARWRPIGTLKNIVLYPMKSGSYVDLKEADCTELGLVEVPKSGLYALKDRNFVVYRLDSMEMVYCMTFPIMTSIKISSVGENTLLFKTPGKDDLEVIIPNSKDANKPMKAKMWTEEIMDLLDCGDEAADWITELIKGNKNVEGKLRLGYWVYNNNYCHTDANYNSRGAYQNYTSYMMMSSSSIDDLSSRIPEHPLTFRQFRPNFLINTFLEPYAEDNWLWVKIGEDDGASFIKVKNCSRCSQINIDPENYKFNRKNEPLNSLNKYRKLSPSDGPVLGICLGLFKAGRVKIGDTVYIAV